MSWRLSFFNLYLRLVEKRYLARETDFARARARMETAAKALPLPPGVQFREMALGGVPALRLGGDPVVFWVHGGAYCLGSPRTHAPMVAAIAVLLGAGAALPDYRLAPEHPFPAAFEDVCAAWDALRAGGVAASRIVLGGDSAGGGLALALLHELLARGDALPAAVVAFSPWVDMTASGDSLRSLARRDVLLPVGRFGEIRDIYLSGADRRDPRASPVFGQFRGAPPVLIQSSRAEILRDDARAMAARLRRDGVTVVHDEWDRVFHAWQILHGRLAEADAALERAAVFLRPLIGAGEEAAAVRLAPR